MGEKYNGKEDSQEGGERREVGCPRNIIETHAIMENRGRIDGMSGAKRERDHRWIGFRDSFGHWPFQGRFDQIRTGCSNWWWSTSWRVLEYLMKRLRFTESTREIGI